MEGYAPNVYGNSLVIMEDMQITNINLDGKEAWTAGRAATGNTVDIPLRSVIASRSHGIFKKFGSEWYYIDDPQNKNGTFYNGRKIPRPNPGTKSRVKLRNGDVLRIDNDDLSQPDQRGIWMLYTTDYVGGQWQYFSLEGREEVRIGSDPRCDLCMPLNYLSQLHARILLHNGRHYVQDCASTAGTLVNNRPISSAQVLQEKDTIALCDCRFIYTSGGLVYLQRG